MTRIRILLAEDHVVVREGLRNLLQLQSDFEIVAEASSGRDAVDLVRQLLPDVVVMDIAMPLLNGIEATRQILRIAPATRVLILSAHSDDEYVAKVAGIGAAGYLVKQASGLALNRAIRKVAAGHSSYSPSILKRINATLQALSMDKTDRGTAIPRLTSRETEVLQLVAEGASNKQIASELAISIKTVEKHRQQLMDKLGIHETAGLTRYAIATGVIDGRSQQPDHG